MTAPEPISRGWRACRPFALALAVCTAAPAAAPAEAPSTRFTEVPGSAGIDLVMTSGAMPSRHILEVNGGGIALFDYDNDGYLDVFIANGAPFERPETGPGSRLYRNRGDGTFEDVTERVGLDVRCWAMGAAVGDFDGDGWDDLYVTCFGPNLLLRNAESEGGGRRFVDVTTQAGVGNPLWSTSAAFADLDGSGHLDLYVANYLEFDPASPPNRAGNAFRGVLVMPGPRGLEGQRDALYRNLGDGRFQEVTDQAGLVIDAGEEYGLAVRILDFFGDGKPDIFVGNDSTADRLYRNLGGMRFEDVAVVAGVAADGLGTTQATMGVCLGDVGGNGFPDLLVTVFSDDTNTLHLNLGDGFFDDATARLGLAAVSRPYLGWGCGFYDFDLSGREGLFIANGHVFPEMEDPRVGGTWAQRPLLFQRRGARFEPVPCRDEWCQRRYHGRSVAFGDLDGDLDVDLLMTTLNGPVLALRNEAQGHALVVRLEQPSPNWRAYGSRVEMESDKGKQRRWVTGSGSYQSVDSPHAYFGLGHDREAIGELAVRVVWPDSTVRVLEGVPPDRLLVVRRGDQAP
jgi:enediyne biosynthesis protein E4